MSQPRRHHIVPQLILRNFTNERGMLWCYRKDNGSCYETKPWNVFVENDMYSVERRDGTKDASTEIEFATGIEAETAPLISRLICCAREGRQLGISCEEKKTLARFMQLQYARTRRTRNISMNDNLFDSVISMSDVKWGRPANKEKLDDEKFRNRLKQKLWLNYLREGDRSDPAAFGIRMSQKIGVMFIQKPRKSFIIGDYPIIRNANEHGSRKLEDIGVLEMLPVAHDVIIHFGRESGCQERVVVDENDVIRSINEGILSQSNAIAGRSRDLLKSLSKTQAARRPLEGWDDTMDDLLAEIKKENSSPFGEYVTRDYDWLGEELF